MKHESIVVTLKDRELEHVKVFWEEMKDDELKKLCPMTDYSLDDAIKLYEHTKKAGSSSFGKSIYAEDTYIGDVWCYSVDEVEHRNCFVSIVIFDKSYWHKGLGTVALDEFMKLIESKYDIDRICAYTYATNTASIRLLEKVGFKIKSAFEEDGVASVYYEYHL
ncbi:MULTISPECIES: GNAT family N-acetyltransferase [unclassified Fusibacter]|uniref:GNAT family N-acetyltransferase n=1 Tax=unclassified Fusibacter TaxID=2624464 RepID=UPI00101192E1|nr:MULTISPECIES: GNAT family N-acetyltransferase [unclassified Fusibacter]MCK8060746.1 GNAT family N-acetyltransferase [Fusibacter sp. A2]NPE23042.1 GNAT family N-acetyltransferase [Fusibacter sp. A1]RXV59714.1 N-acetyltransferase [Fusibacter sp. A1]